MAVFAPTVRFSAFWAQKRTDTPPNALKQPQKALRGLKSAKKKLGKRFSMNLCPTGEVWGVGVQGQTANYFVPRGMPEGQGKII